MRVIATTIAVVALIAPQFTFASILINEIAWMGSADSANDEWIELFNNSDTPVSLEGWVLTDSVSLEVELAGTVGAGEFAVLERTDDTSAPGVAFLIYTGALANDGRKLTLRRADSAIEDQISGGENWEIIGGSNETKDTAQRTGGGWITAPSTPGQTNGGSPTLAKSSGVSLTSSREEKEKPEKISLLLPDTELALGIQAPTIAYVHQPVAFTAVPSGIGDALMESLVYNWNFGDTYTGAGTETTHAFSHPGEYLIVTSAEYKRHHAVGRHKISILPYTLTLSKKSEDTLIITNNTAFESDLSNFILQGDTRIVFPEHTYLLPNAAMSIDAARVQKGIVKTVTLLDTKGNIVALYTPNLALVSHGQPTTTAPYMGNEPIVVEATEPEVELAVEEPITQTKAPSVNQAPIVLRSEEEPATTSSTLVASAGSADANTSHTKLAYYGLLGVILLGIFSLYTTRKKHTVVTVDSQ